MKRIYSRLLVRILLVIVANTITSLTSLCQRNEYESYYLSRPPSFPALWDPDGWPGDREIQGVTHDDNNWYFTWTNSSPDIGFLWKIPVGVALDNSAYNQTSNTIVDMRQFPELAGYWHWGDPDHHKYNGIDFIVVPMTGGSTPMIAIFRTNLELAGYARLYDANGQNRPSIAWCAIHPLTHDLYTSEDFDWVGPNGNYHRYLQRYTFPWDSIPPSGPAKEFTITYSDSHELLDQNDATYELYNMQGGEFTPHGELLYIVNGSGFCAGIGDGQYYYDGLHAFDASDLTAWGWKEIRRATNRVDHGYFDYEYILRCDGCFGGSWSPEGLTIWNLDDGRAPFIAGELHVLVFHYNVGCANEVAFEHFGKRLTVDAVNGTAPVWPSWGDPFPGDPRKPFRTFGDAYNWYPVWDGAEIVIKAGSYPAVGTYSKRVRLVSQGGSAILGR